MAEKHRDLQPIKKLSFKDAFWGTDFTSYRGYEVLHQRMKDAKAFTDDFDSYIRQRAAIEETYAKALVKLAKSSGGNTESGTMKACWDVLKAETESVGNIHLKVAHKLHHEIDRPNRGFRDGQRDFRKKIEDDMKRAQKLKTNAYNSNVKAKKNYESKCRESEKADEEVSRGVGVVPPKDLEKLRAKARKAKASAEAADSSYIDAVRALDDARQLWEKEMESLCVHFQRLEEERLAFLRNQMWLLSNIVSQACVDDDERQEALRKVLEKCNIDTDIQEFIRNNMTGTERPAPITYQNFYAPANSEMQRQRTTMAVSGSASPPPSSVAQLRASTSPPQMRRMKSPPPGKADPNSQSTGSNGSQNSGGGGGNGAARAKSPPVPTEPNPGVAMPPAAFKAKAQFDYEAQGPLELSLKSGDIITVTQKEDEVWWRGNIGSRHGVFPAAFVKEVPQ